MKKPNYECSVCGNAHYKKDLVSVDGMLICQTCLEEVHCEVCGTPEPRYRCENLNGKILCQWCYDNEHTHCEQCGDEILLDDAVYADGEYYCNYCADKHLVVCDHCGDRIHRDNATEDEYIFVCDTCMSNHYYRCLDCRRLVEGDEAIHIGENVYCEDCAPSNRDIHDYGYKPTANFFGGLDMNAAFMGVELEVDKGGDEDDCAHALTELNRPTELFYCKHDGSLDEGIEIVTHPMTLRYHMTEMKWREVIEICKSYGFKSHDANTCGLHVHFSRNALGATTDECDVTIMKILFFYERFWDKIMKFSRRKESQTSRWAKRYGLDGTTESSAKRLLESAKCSGDRYRAVNLMNSATVEFRIFRGTLNLATLIATLQFCYELVQYCKVKSIVDIASSTWGSFLSSITMHTELDAYLTRVHIRDDSCTGSVSDRESFDDNSGDIDTTLDECDDDVPAWDLEEEWDDNLDFLDV